jgi:hypothetical protein
MQLRKLHDNCVHIVLRGGSVEPLTDETVLSPQTGLNG